jgi:hypothetical protein
MPPDWICVYSTNKAFEAEFVKTMLESNDIECILVNKQDSSYLIGEIELYVSTELSFEAKQLILQQIGE